MSASGESPWWLSWAAAGTAVVAAATAADGTRFADPDLFMNLMCARHVAETGAVPAVDVYSFARPALAWNMNEWLGQLTLYGVFEVAGGPGLVLARLALAGAAAALLLVAAHRARAPLWAALVALLVCWPAVAHFFLFRVRTVSFLLLALLIVLLIEHRRGARWVAWVVPPLVALWANLHGAFVLGLGVLVLAAVDDVLPWRAGRPPGRRRWALGLATLLAAALALAHPCGIGVYHVVLGTVGGPSIDTISEWLPVWDHPLRSTWTYGLLVVLALPVAARIAWRRRSVLWPGVLLAVAVQTVLHVRFGALLGVVLMVPLAQLLASLRPAQAGRAATAVLAALAAAFTLYTAATGPRDLQVRMQPEWSPVAAVDFMAREGIRGDVLAEYDWGAYVVWRLPDARVFIDSRSDTVYPPEVEREWSRFALREPGWEDVLQGSGATAVLLRTRRGAEAPIARSPEWGLVYLDDHASLLLRDAAVNRPFLERLRDGEVPAPPVVTDEQLILRRAGGVPATD